MKVAVIILNRNLPEITDRLANHLMCEDAEVFVVEAGSEDSMLSQHTTWHADWPEARSEGLRFCRGFNFGLLKLYQSGRFAEFDAFFLVTNDTEFQDGQVVSRLADVMIRHPKVGLLSPCSRRWGEKLLLVSKATRYFWYVHNTAFMLRRPLIEALMEQDQPTFMNFLFDGTNFRGYGTETEIVAKGYANDWATAITAEVWAEENETWLRSKADLIRTDSYESNLAKYVDEGGAWMRRKYGFSSRWHLQMYAKFWYEKFFEYHPECSDFKI